MVNKYRRLLMVEAEVKPHGGCTRPASCRSRSNQMLRFPRQRSSPSSEMVMMDRTFNQEERNNLTQDKRMVLVDPGRHHAAERTTTSPDDAHFLCSVSQMASWRSSAVG